MNVEILDKGVFEGLNPNNLVKYLEANHWEQIKEVPGDMLIFERIDGENFHRVWVPLKPKYRDFSVSMATAFKAIAQAEERSQLLLLEDLETTAIGDVVSVDTYDRLDKNSHTLPLNEGLAIHQQARQLALAGAWNAAVSNPIQRRSIYPTTPRSEISQFMSSLRLAQSGRQSYVVRVLSPVRIEVEQTLPLPLEDVPEATPFERRALLEMLRGLNTLHQIAQDNFRRGKFALESFEEGVMAGISANLCDAVAPVNVTDGWRPLQVGVHWCLTAPKIEGAPKSEIEFTPDLLTYVHEASMEFRRKSTEDVSITAYVYSMRWDEDLEEGQGRILMRAYIEPTWRTVRTSVSGQAHDVANEAYMKRQPIRVEGTLRSDNNRFRLENPRNFRFEED